MAINLKDLCYQAIQPNIGMWDPTEPGRVKDTLVGHFGSDSEALAGCKELLGLGGTSKENLLTAMEQDLLTPLTVFEMLNQIKEDIIGNHIASFFVVVIGLYLILALILGTRHWMTRHAVVVLPTLGILGTFVGVYYALLKFKPELLHMSFQQIVEGLKIAFTTSIIGMIGGLIVRLNNSRSESQTLDKTEVGPDEILEELVRSRRDNKTSFDKLNSALVGEGDASISTQLIKMRSDLNDFAKTVAEANTSALIEALREVISDFNEKMSEQFGENFKKLNEAVGRLVEWQENYKNDLDYLRSAMNDAVKAIEGCKAAIEKIAESSSSIPVHMTALEGILEITGRQLSDLEERLEAFSSIRDKAQDAFPHIEKLLTTYTEKLGQAVSDAVQSLQSGMESQKASMGEIRLAYSQLGEDVSRIGEELGQSVENVLKENLKTINLSIKSAQNAQDEHLKAVYEKQMDAIKGLDQSYQELRDDARQSSEIIVETIRTSSEKHGEFIEGVHDQQIKALSEMEGAYGQLREKAEESANIVAEAIQENRDQLETAVKSMENSVSEIGPALEKTLSGAMETLTASLDEFMQKQQAEAIARLDALSETLDARYERATGELTSLLKNLMEETRDAFSEVIRTNMEWFDQHIGSLAEHLGRDYRPLIEELRKLIEAAETAQRERDTD